MLVEELAQEVATTDSHLAHLQQADHPDYEVLVQIAHSDAEMLIVTEVRWEHNDKQMVIVANVV